MRQAMPHVYKMLEHPKDKGYKEEEEKQPIALHTTCYASCPKPKSKTNIRKKLANKTKQGMRQIWITHVHIFCSQTLKRQEVWEKK